jgi:hypothetical protein
MNYLDKKTYTQPKSLIFVIIKNRKNKMDIELPHSSRDIYAKITKI